MFNNVDKRQYDKLYPLNCGKHKSKGMYSVDFNWDHKYVYKSLLPPRSLKPSQFCPSKIATMKSAIATLALAASVSAFAPAPVTKSSTALNDVWDSYSELFFIALKNSVLLYLKINCLVL